MLTKSNIIDQMMTDPISSSRQKQVVYLLRHAKPKIDTTKPPAKWELDEVGKSQSQQIASNDTLQHVNVIYSSTEKKAYQTVLPLANQLNLSINQMSDLNEAKMGQFYPTEDEFIRAKLAKFRNFNLTDGEAHENAFSRFTKAVSQIKALHPQDQILISTHGTVMTLYLAHLQGMGTEDMIDYWLNLNYGYFEVL